MNTKTLLACLGLILFFVVLHIVFGARVDLLNLDRERTPAAIFSALQLIASGYALVTVFFLSETRGKKIVWASLGIIFMFLGLDEVSELHENAAYYLVKYFPPFPFLQSGTPMWIVFLSPVILGIFGFLIAATREVRAHSRRLGQILIGSFILVISAIVLEFLGGTTALAPFLPTLLILEESAELVAGTLFLYVFSNVAKERFLAKVRF
ncbi:MAG: hypothetical protein Q8P56_05690 [Candidatus Uhrbacteria bacterium]|nr:hypothetical protein [Candidatus Uhrbacteria bacterium]